MKNEWAIEKINEFIRLATPQPRERQTSRFKVDLVGTEEELISAWVFVEEIFKVTYPEWSKYHQPVVGDEYGNKREAALHARSKIENEKEISENLSPTGPILRAENLHASIWNQAKDYWSGGFFRAALQSCGTLVDAKMQEFTGRRDITGRDLVNQSFSSDKPQIGKPRIRVPNQENLDATKSFQEGLHHLGVSCVALIRNPSSHNLEEPAEYEALEQLAIFSHFLRNLELCSLEKFSEN